MRDRFELYFSEEEFQDLSLSLSLARPTVTGDALRRLPTFHARVIPAMGGKQIKGADSRFQASYPNICIISFEHRERRWSILGLASPPSPLLLSIPERKKDEIRSRVTWQHCCGFRS